MAQQESNILNRIRLALSKGPVRLFRNNVGLFTTDKGDKVRTGLCVGSHDLIGWKTITITPDMVGQDIAVFTSIEVKTKKGRASGDQLNWMDKVQKAGGIAGIARSEDDAEKILKWNV